MRKQYIGVDWEHAKTRGTRHNQGIGIKMATEIGAVEHGIYSGCHAVPMDLKMPNYGNLEIPYIERKHYRKICYFLGVMLNANGERFVDEGINPRKEKGKEKRFGERRKKKRQEKREKKKTIFCKKLILLQEFCKSKARIEICDPNYIKIGYVINF